MNREEIIMEENRTFTLAEDGFVGKLFCPKKDEFLDKALVFFTGSDGSFELACLGGQFFANHELTTLSIAYFKQPGLPQTLANIPIETVEKAARWLKNAGYAKIGVWGISMGAELALLAGAYMPELLSCVIAASPICVISQGLGVKNAFLPCSAFTWRGKDLPYAPYPFPKITLRRMLRSWRRYGDFGYRFCYEKLVEAPPAQSVIPAQKIHGPILLISGKLDSMWPAYESGEYLMQRLNSAQFAYPHTHLVYEYGSHFMVPMHLKSERIFKSKRKHKAESDAYKKDQLEKTISFLQAW